MSEEFAFSCSIYGYEEPFSKEKLKAMYNDIENYRSIITEDAKKCIDKGLLLAEDMQQCINISIKKAKKYGLE
ncbi:hypothetical protein JCM21714_2161 [Gracilibacillus boraciitolerans JCM 21714]|uniref:Alpha/beta hydrolase domain-containing protein n=1 Tax=Gracilibacillus boraciitolerans JCM 21714 TaxID=1298598 RepID=W4VIT5_9BACI|nr:alpha/beta hydrolase domain-containing protein [Gracilibacillus boraciitolerans]GAE93122.1 hypothetical protein JCM21714_2161 [Gracilibacillus boraciitolerans JCM 21714]